RNVALARALQPPHDAVDDTLEPIGIDRPLAQGHLHRAHQLVAIEGFALAGALDHGQLAQLDPLEGGEAGAAVRALPPAAARRGVVGRPRALDLRILVAAERAAHRPPPSPARRLSPATVPPPMPRALLVVAPASESAQDYDSVP